MLTIPDDLMRRLRAASQEHVFRCWDRLNEDDARTVGPGAKP